MADDSDVSVRFGADTAPLEAGAQEAAGAVNDFGAQVAAMSEAIVAQTEAMVEGFRGVQEALAETAAAAAAEHEAEEMEGLFAVTREGVSQVTELRESLLNTRNAVMEFFAVKEIVDWAKEMAEATEHAKQLGERLGMTTSEVQGWQAVATLTGRSQDQFAMAMTRLTDNAIKAAQGSKEQAAAMKDLGLSTADALNPQKLMLDIADKYQALGDGPAAAARKIADAMVLMGRSGADMIPILNEGASGIQEMMDKGRDYGAVVDASVNKQNLEAAERMNELKLAFQGFSETLFSTVAPALTTFVQNLTNRVVEISHAMQSGNAFSEAMNDLKVVVAGVGAALATFATMGLAETVVEALMAVWLSISRRRMARLRKPLPRDVRRPARHGAWAG